MVIKPLRPRTYYVSENNLEQCTYFEIFENKDVIAEEIGNAPYYIDEAVAENQPGTACYPLM